ncbi:MAG: Trk system potassium transporter TrkA [Bacteroidales bacterium]|nr:Trk system potassium transporter TrkA [Candidatus Cryptobacteroides choladohippi]MCQ2180099.1 Trk system potassium transporter TrkA [Bacteroidales bacterium]
MKIVIAGAGEIGSHLAKMLRDEANEVTVVDDDASRLSALASSVDVQTIQGPISSLKLLREAGTDKADLYIAVYPYTTQEVNIVSAMLAHQLGAGKVIARINDEDYLSPENKLIFKEMGIELMFYPEKSASDEIVSALKHSTTTDTMDFARGKLQIACFKLDEEAPVLDLKLGEFIKTVPPAELEQFRIIAIGRDNETVIPKMDSKFRFGDLVFTISRKDGMQMLSRHFGKSDVLTKRVMIMGGTAIAEMVARSLAKLGTKVKIIDKDKSRCIDLTEKLPKNVEVICGDGRNADILYEEGISECDAFISLTSRDANNILACVVARKYGVPRTIAEVENIEYVHLAEEMGVSSVINKKTITAGRIFKFTLSGKARFVRYMSGTNAEVVEYTVAPGSAITRSAIKDLDFPANAIIGGVIRGNDAFIAVGDTRIEPYDRVAIFTKPESLREIDKFFK